MFRWLLASDVEEGVPAYVENSRRGGHLWLFFSQAVAGQEARVFGLGLLSAHQLEGVELFPKQDRLGEGPGSLIRMPFGVHRLTGQRYGFHTPDGSPVAPSIREQIQVLSARKFVPEAAFEAYRSFAPPHPAPAIKEPLETPTDLVSEKIKKLPHADVALMAGLCRCRYNILDRGPTM